jgi:hypothetical protein
MLFEVIDVTVKKKEGFGNSELLLAGKMRYRRAKVVVLITASGVRNGQ